MDNLSYAILSEFGKHQTLTLEQIYPLVGISIFQAASYIDYLRQMGYISDIITTKDPGWKNTPMQITVHGRIALETELSTRKSHWWNEFRAWITLAIAVAAFIKSFFIQ